jgi:ribosomal protein L11 methyltransferase
MFRVSLRVPLERREETVARLLDLVPGGLEEVEHGSVVELAVFVDEPQEAEIRGAFPDSVTVPVEPGWEDRWREFHRPVWAGGVWLGPPWETPPAGVPAVVIDPGRAFGTGAHPTTRLCVELLAGYEARGSLLDVGCGSGVLAIAAARLGFGPIHAIDDDPIAVGVTCQNAAANGVAIHATVADGLRDPLPATGTAVANVLLAPVEGILARLESTVAVTSGYLAGEVPAHRGWDRVATETLDGWAADVFLRER